MICKNCKTAISEADKICPNCGKKITNPSKTAAIIVFVVAIIAVVVFLFKDKIFKSTETTPYVNEVIKPIEKVNNPEALGEVIPQIEQPKPEPVKDLEKSAEEVDKMLTNLVEATQFYYDRYKEQSVFLTKGGFLYDLPAEAYVVVKDLFSVTTEADPIYENENVLFLFVKPSDISNSNKSKEEGEEALEIYAAYQRADGFMFKSANGTTGEMSQKQYDDLIDKYNYEYGEIIRYAKDTEEFNEILNAVKESIDSKDEFDVRYLAGDRKYAYVAASKKGSSTAVYQYILVKEKSKWNVIMKDFESVFKYKELINTTITNFNFAILPKFNLYYELKFLKSDFATVAEAMKKDGLITGDDGDLVYSSGTNDFVFMEFEKGSQFLGNVNDEGVWVMYPVYDYKEAELLMQNLSNDPPFHIIKQN